VVFHYPNVGGKLDLSDDLKRGSCRVEKAQATETLTHWRRMPKAMCGKHAVPLMLRRNSRTGEIALACPYCDMEERGGGQDERSIIDDALREKPKQPN